MPLSAVNFVPLTGQIKAADMAQFFNLFTGVMTDQPVTFANTLTIGGSQAVGNAPLSVKGVTNQTANMLEIRKLAADTQPMVSISATGSIGIGPGAGVAPDVVISRSAANQISITGLAGTPAVVIPVGGLQITAGNVGIGAAPITSQGLNISVPINDAGTGALGVNVSSNITANTNSVSLLGVQINPTFLANGKTGLVIEGLSIAGVFPAAGQQNIALAVSQPTAGSQFGIGILVGGGTGASSVQWSALFNSGQPVGIGNNSVALAQSGDLRLGNNRLISWRNAGGGGDDTLGFDASDRLALVGAAAGGTSAATGSAPVVYNGVVRNFLFF